MNFERLMVGVDTSITSLDVDALAHQLDCYRYEILSIQALSQQRTQIIIDVDNMSALRLCQKFSKPRSCVLSGEIHTLRIQRYRKLPTQKRRVTASEQSQVPIYPKKAEGEQHRQLHQEGQVIPKRTESMDRKSKEKKEDQEGVKELSVDYVGHLLDTLGDRIIEVQQVFDHYSVKNQLNLRGIALASAEIKGTLVHTASVLYEIRSSLQDLRRLKCVALESIPINSMEPFLSYINFIAFVVETEVLCSSKYSTPIPDCGQTNSLEASVTTNASSNDEEFAKILDKEKQDDKILTPEIESVPIGIPTPLCMLPAIPSAEDINALEKLSMEKFRQEFEELDLYGHDNCHEISIAELYQILKAIFPQKSLPIALYEDILEQCLSDSSSMSIDYDESTKVLQHIIRHIPDNKAPKSPSASSLQEEQHIERETQLVVDELVRLIEESAVDEQVLVQAGEFTAQENLQERVQEAKAVEAPALEVPQEGPELTASFKESEILKDTGSTDQEEAATVDIAPKEGIVKAPRTSLAHKNSSNAKEPGAGEEILRNCTMTAEFGQDVSPEKDHPKPSSNVEPKVELQGLEDPHMKISEVVQATLADLLAKIN